MQLQIESEAEFVGAKIISGKQTIIIGALYRPPSSKQPYMNVLNQVIEEICVSNPGVAVWIAGDANLPDIDWATDRVVGHQYPLELNESFLQMLARTGMEQLVDFPTRNESILDIIITNRPSLINRCEGLPALGDHDIVYADWNAQASRVKPSRRKIFLWNHADFDLIRQETKEWADKFVSRNTTSTPVELLSREIEQYLQKILHDRVPSKLSSTRFNQPWFNTSTKRICRRKARAFKKARKTNRDRDWKRFRRLKKQSQITCRQAYNKYLTDIIRSEPGASRRLGAIIKAKRCQDQAGIAPLKEGNHLFSDPKTKANLLNRQFASVFTKDDSSPLPDLGPSTHPPMNGIQITNQGIVKLLKNLNPYKASGPDGVPARLLKETRKRSLQPSASSTKRPSTKDLSHLRGRKHW
ncbi:uncharacterized protein [Amphiura filiformis]|uniref:uncharacterized protein n=1 Tax=Amphiura filiformis TaxID=82378 RepID=UPI003B20C343